MNNIADTPEAAANKNQVLASRDRVQFTLPALFLTITVIASLFGATLFVARVAGLNSTQALAQVFLPWVMRCPEVAVWAVGAILLVTHRNLQSRVKRHAIVGLAGLLIVSFAGSLLNMWLVTTLVSKSIPVIEDYYTQILIARGFIESLLKAVCWLMLLRAAFGLAVSTRQTLGQSQ